MDFFRKLKQMITRPKARVSLKLGKNTYMLGEDLKGSLNVTSEEEFDATELRVELRCVERKRKQKYEWDEEKRREELKEYWETATLHSADVKVSEGLHLTPGYRKKFSFSANIPAGGRTSYDSIDGSVTWSVKGVLAVKGRPDVTSETLEVQVVEPPEVQTVIKEKEVIREVVMIPCPYCGALMPQTAIKCPHCGAPRKG